MIVLHHWKKVQLMGSWAESSAFETNLQTTEKKEFTMKIIGNILKQQGCGRLSAGVGHQPHVIANACFQNIHAPAANPKNRLIIDTPHREQSFFRPRRANINFSLDSKAITLHWVNYHSPGWKILWRLQGAPTNKDRLTKFYSRARSAAAKLSKHY